MLVFPIRCRRLKQCPHNLRLLEERRRCPSARVMLPTFIFLCFFLHSETRWSTSRDTENLACTSVGIWLNFNYTLGDPLVGASTDFQNWRNQSNEKMLLPSPFQSSSMLLSSTSSKFVCLQKCVNVLQKDRERWFAGHVWLTARCNVVTFTDTA